MLQELKARHGAALACVACAATWAVVALMARARGFSCISDDDFARVTIAQVFARAPSVDPSGTSWLPFPFWSNGLALMVLGRSLQAARAAAVLHAAASGALLFASGRHARLGVASAAVGALLPLTVPLDRLLAAATVPEIPTAALTIYALFALRDAPLRAALAVTLAALSRYEAWPAAALVAGALALSATPLRERVLGALLALSGPLAWLGWNAHAHGDALHFAHRVATYRAGLGVTADALAYAMAAGREGGALLAAAAVATLVLGREGWTRFGLPCVAAVVLVLAPTVAAVWGGAPTHHPERAVVAVWMLAAVIAAGAGPEAALSLERIRPMPTVMAVTGVIIACGVWRTRPTWMSLGPPRTDELLLGNAVADELSPGTRFVLVPPSFAYLATVAASGRPEDARAIVLRSVDPRSRIDADPLASLETLREAALREDASWVVALGEQQSRLRALGVVAVTLPGGALARVR